MNGSVGCDSVGCDSVCSISGYDVLVVIVVIVVVCDDYDTHHQNV